MTSSFLHSRGALVYTEDQHLDGYFDILRSNTPSVGSDDRLKHEEQDITNALETVKKIKPKFYWKTSEITNSYEVDDENGTWEAGYIAQDVRAEIPELAFTVVGEEYDASGNPTPLALAYNSIQPYLTKAIQELSVLNDEKTAQIASMQTTITDLLSRIATLESRI